MPLERLYIIVSGSRGPTQNPRFHPDQASALREAERLATANPDDHFDIYASLKRVKVQRFIVEDFIDERRRHPLLIERPGRGGEPSLSRPIQGGSSSKRRACAASGYPAMAIPTTGGAPAPCRLRILERRGRMTQSLLSRVDELAGNVKALGEDDSVLRARIDRLEEAVGLPSQVVNAIAEPDVAEAWKIRIHRFEPGVASAGAWVPEEPAQDPQLAALLDQVTSLRGALDTLGVDLAELRASLKPKTTARARKTPRGRR